MDKSNIELFTVNKDTNIIDAMKKIDNHAKGVVFVVDGDKLVGALSDGDIRRWLIKTGDLSICAERIMNTAPKAIYANERESAIAILNKYKVHVVPVLNENREIVDIILEESTDLEELGPSSSLHGIPVVIMAGGKGTRLYPYTKILPKPLIPINDIPILERILNQFKKYNADNIYLSVNYKKEMIKSYFKELDCDYCLKYVEENKPLGTAGSIKLVAPELSGPVIVTNCDILIRADYTDILSYHKKSGNAITVVSAMMESTIPYGVIKQDENGYIKAMEEKPTIPYVVNTGMYVVESEYLERIPEDTFYHMTDLVNDLLKHGIQVGMYPVSAEAFLDMGEFVELQRMEDKLKSSIN